MKCGISLLFRSKMHFRCFEMQNMKKKPFFVEKPLDSIRTKRHSYNRERILGVYMTEYHIREITQAEYKVLEDFLYEAIFLPEGVLAPPRDIIKQPELQVYVENFGSRKGDYCLVAEVDGTLAGAVWVRIMQDYGHVDEETPSLAISLYKDYRSCGIGTAMMKQMLRLLKKEGYQQVSLSVQKANYAAKMYESLGFETVDENEEEYIMVCRLLGDALIAAAGQLHTTPMGAERIRRNLGLEASADVVEFCKEKVRSSESYIFKKGKNWYCDTGDAVITINSFSYTIITAHKRKHRVTGQITPKQ